MSLTKPVLGLAVGGALGLLDGLSGFLEPSLAPVMGSVITFSLLKGLVAGIATGYVSQRVHSMLLCRECCSAQSWDLQRKGSGVRSNRLSLLNEFFGSSS